jgi:predicted nucleic-acid-binding protein
MIALDTNVLVRYIVQDDPAQAKKATKIIEDLTVASPAFISCIVLCEINWVLQTAYKIPKKNRFEALQGILSVAVFDVERLGSCLKALKLYEGGSADFSDYLIQQIAGQAGYDTVLSFDKKALKHAGFKSP